MGLFKKKEVKEKAVDPQQLYASDLVDPQEQQYQRGALQNPIQVSHQESTIDRIGARVERMGEGMSQMLGGGNFQQEQEVFQPNPDAELEALEKRKKEILAQHLAQRQMQQAQQQVQPRLPELPPMPQQVKSAISDEQLVEAFAEIDKRLTELSERLTNMELRLFRKGL